MDHFHKVPGARRAAMQVSLSGGAPKRSPTNGQIGIATTGGQRSENRIQSLCHGSGSAYHQTVSSFQAPNPSTRADVEVMNVSSFKRMTATDIVPVKRITTINDRAFGRKQL